MSGETNKRGGPAVLIVEDDDNLRFGLAENLKSLGYVTRAVPSGEAAEEAVLDQAYDLIILDIMLPGVDGYTLCKRFRARGIDSAILMLTARALEDDLVRGFEAGADDYLAKPYRLRELKARVSALLRRRTARPAESYRFGEYHLDLVARTLVDEAHKAVDVTRTEFDLLAFLLKHRGRALGRDEILEQVWGQDVVVDQRTVDNFVSSLKKKLTARGFQIQTVRGVGYRFEVDED